MICSTESLEENIASTKAFVDLVKPIGITVEGELGLMPNNMPLRYQAKQNLTK